MTSTTPTSHGRRRLLRRLWDRGATEAALILVAAAVASGVLFGAGIARGSSETTDGQTWLPDGSSGDVVRVNPVTGQPETPADLGLAGVVSVTQGDGVLVVTDSSGKSVTVDLTTLLAGGKRDTEDAKILLRHGRTYLAALDTGVIRAINPVNLDDLGTAYSAGHELADVVVDDQDIVWAMGKDGTLTSLRWSDDAQRFVSEDAVPVKGAGDGTKLVPHAQGVTVWSPKGGTVLQVGTGKDVEKVIPGLTGSNVMAADESPDDLTAASLPDAGTVLLWNGSAFVSTAVQGCPKPGKPSVFDNRVYVPCEGSGRTVVLDRNGRTAAADIVTDDGKNPIITADEGNLTVTSEGGKVSTTVDRDGTTKKTDLRENPVPKVNADKPPPYYQPPTTTPPPPPSSSSSSSAPSSSAGASQTQAPGPGSQTGGPGGPGGSGGPGAGGGPGGSGTNPAGGGPGEGSGSGAPAQGATGVGATAAGPGTVAVSWKGPGTKPKGFRIETTTGQGSTSAPAGSTAATVTGLTPGATVRFVVYTVWPNGQTQSSPSNTVVVPGAAATTTAAPPVTTTAAPPPPVTTTEAPPPPATTTEAPPPVTTTEAPPPVTPAPDSPTNIVSGSSDARTVSFSWTPPANGTQTSYTATATADYSGATQTQTLDGTATGVTFTFAFGEVGTTCDGGSGVTLTLTASNATGTSAPATGYGAVSGTGGTAGCSCGMIPAGYGGAPMGPAAAPRMPAQCPAAAKEPAMAAPAYADPAVLGASERGATGMPQPRYAVALGLLLLAGGVRWGRWAVERRTPEEDER